MSLTATDVFSRGVEDGVCLIWTGWKNSDGYGYVRFEGKDQPVHRVVFVLNGGEIPSGYEIDHTCKNRACIRLGHLEVVTHAENMSRAKRTSCRRAGHDWTDPRNVRVRRNGDRYCAECDRERMRVRSAA